MAEFSEADMYPPVERFFAELGYAVQAEVLDCDVALMKDGQLLLIELKKHFNVTLLYQAMRRQKATSQVYVAVPRPKRARGEAYHGMVQIVKKLELGLITVAMDSPRRAVEILVFPPAAQGGDAGRRGDVLRELAGRKTARNVGGSKGGTRLMTAFREQSIQVACALYQHGDMTAKALRAERGCPPNTYGICKRNCYGWFKALPEAVFTLSAEGRRAIEDGRYPETTAYYLAH